ncbi:MAG: hypothetical protein IPF54_26815 [Draconibacterium sp.]|nr:hypothetical protein [Draconibacterium sp.]
MRLLAAFDAIDPTIAAVKPRSKSQAVRTLLAAKPGSKIEATKPRTLQQTKRRNRQGNHQQP